MVGQGRGHHSTMVEENDPSLRGFCAGSKLIYMLPYQQQYCKPQSLNGNKKKDKVSAIELGLRHGIEIGGITEEKWALVLDHYKLALNHE